MSKSEFSEEADNVPEFGTTNLILHELFHHKYLSLIPTTDMSEYLSIPTALEIVKKEIHLSGGRISRTDLQVSSFLLIIFL